MNGSVGTINDILYETRDGPDKENALPAYIFVEFPNSNLPAPLIPGKPNTWIPVPVITERCERKCCSVQNIPLRVCIAITIHKSQGMTIGDGEIFEKAVVYLPESETKGNAGLELVAFSRVKSPYCLAVGNKRNKQTKRSIQNIGKSDVYTLRRQFQNELEAMDKQTRQPTINAITDLDTAEGNSKTYEGGCEYLLKWFHKQISSVPVN